MNENQLSTPETRAAGTVPVKNWRWVLRIGLAVGLAVPIARDVTPALWPGLLSFWGATIASAAIAGVVGAIVSLLVGGLFKLYDRA